MDTLRSSLLAEEDLEAGQLRDKFRGCLIAGAAGDALGYPVEFLAMPDIEETYGMRGITKYKLTNGTAIVSDDTQMTMYTAAGLLNAFTWGAINRRQPDYRRQIAQAYRDWCRQQDMSLARKGLADMPKSQAPATRLFAVRGLCADRDPGTTCMNALRSGETGSVDEAINDSKGCGGVMRAAPVGLFAGTTMSLDDVAWIAAESAAITHGHELGWLSAAALACLITAIIREPDRPLKDLILDSMEVLKDNFDDREYVNELLNLMEQAIGLAEEKGLPDGEAIAEIGEGWVGEQALAIALFCALRHEDNLEAALVAAVNHDGDSDSTGSITGNILGAKIGLAAIPDKFLNGLEHCELLIELADDLFDCRALGLTKETAKSFPEWMANYGPKNVG